jgi:hypothetical protein
MISAVITQLRDEWGLEASLAGLAGAAIDGLVREAMVIDVAADPAVREAADEAGAVAVSAASQAEGLTTACMMARGPWILIIPAGVRLQSGWEGAARAHIDRHLDRAGWFTLASNAAGPGARLGEALANLRAAWFGRPEPRQGLLISKALFDERLSGLGALDYADMIRRVGGKVLRRIEARALG